MPLSDTQKRLLDKLREVRAAGSSRIPDADARARGGLTHWERLEYLGVHPDGTWVGSPAASCGGVVRGVSYRTYLALERAGLVEAHRRDDYTLFVAKD